MNKAQLYALFDFELNQKYNWSIKKFVQKCKKLDAKVIQYRDKINNLDKKREILLRLRKEWKGILIINDELELANLVDGIHLGQEDITNIDIDKKNAIKKIREKIGKRWIGLSTHNAFEIKEANNLDIEYIGLGAYRNTSTKKDIKGILGEDIKRLSKLSYKDVAIIGGVRVDDEIDFAKYKVVGSDIYLYN